MAHALKLVSYNCAFILGHMPLHLDGTRSRMPQTTDLKWWGEQLRACLMCCQPSHYEIKQHEISQKAVLVEMDHLFIQNVNVFIWRWWYFKCRHVLEKKHTVKLLVWPPDETSKFIFYDFLILLFFLMFLPNSNYHMNLTMQVCTASFCTIKALWNYINRIISLK